MKKIKVSPKAQWEIFETVFIYLIEIPSMRWKLRDMIKSREKVEQAELNLALRKLELEIIKQKEGS